MKFNKKKKKIKNNKSLKELIRIRLNLSLIFDKLMVQLSKIFQD